jgi:predicted nucleotidyltransferase
MEVQKDFKELLELLNSRGAEYLIVGGYALALHGAPRYTGDLDVYVKPVPENAFRVMDALEAFGFGSVGLKQEDFHAPEQIIQLGLPPVRIDIITSISGVTWDEALSGSVDMEYGGVPVKILGRREFIANKKAVGRSQDLADVDAIGGP